MDDYWYDIHASLFNVLFRSKPLIAKLGSKKLETLLYYSKTHKTHKCDRQTDFLIAKAVHN